MKISLFGTCHFKIIARNIKAIFKKKFRLLCVDAVKILRLQLLLADQGPHTVFKFLQLSVYGTLGARGVFCFVAKPLSVGGNTKTKNSALLENTTFIKFIRNHIWGLEWRIFQILTNEGDDDFTDIKFVS